MTQNELARAAGLSSGTVSSVMNGRRPGVTVCRKLADGLKVPPETVLRLAGHLPKGREFDPEIDELVGLFERLDEDAKRDTLRIVRVLLEGQKNGRRVPAKK